MQNAPQEGRPRARISDRRASRLRRLLVAAGAAGALALGTARLPGLLHTAAADQAAGGRAPRSGHDTAAGRSQKNSASSTELSDRWRELRGDSSGLPVVYAAQPGVVRLRPAEASTALLFGRRLDGVTGVRVVDSRGAADGHIEARLLPRLEGACEPLFIELTAHPPARAGSFRLQLNTHEGGIYLPAELTQIVVPEIDRVEKESPR